jgi:two-component system cell cycle sensor histidine kinase/response regulator CckA
MAQNRHEVCLVDYRLGAQNGIELLRAAIERGCAAPIILLTGQGEHEIDLEAMKAGAADYLVKSRLDARLLERSIRYALERQRAATRAAAEQMRLATFGATVGLALTRQDSLEAILQDCAAALGRFLNASLARICIYDEPEQTLKPRAAADSSGGARDPGLGEPRLNVPLEQFAKGESLLINKAQSDPRVVDHAWAAREGISSLAAYPLMLENRLVGLMTVYARGALSEATLQEMASVANGIALCIERKRSAEALQASEVRYRAVVENIKEVIFQLDEAGRWSFLNPAWTDVTGFKISETLGRHFGEFIHAEDRARHSEFIEEVLQHKVSFCREVLRFLAVDGRFRWVEVYAQPNLNSNDSPSGISGTISDITERRRAEAEIQKLAAFPRYNPEPVMEIDAAGEVTYVNDAAQALACRLKMENPTAILPPDVADIARACLATGQNRAAVEVSLAGRTLAWSFFPITSNHVVHAYGPDITERKNLEAQLLQSQKMESIGQLAAGVAHDFNNILTIIQGRTDRVIAQMDGDDNVTGQLREVSTAATRAAGLTQQLLMFSRKKVMQPRVLDPSGVLDGMTKMLQRLLGEQVVLESRCEAKLPAIEADAGMIEQVIMNLAVNARDAMPRGGRLNISLVAREVDAAYTQQNSAARVGRFLCLSVSDSGCGMSKETMARIFEPFFTTKEVGKGTGLGLATVYGIVHQHQGWVEVESELKVGTTFRVFLPATNKTLEAIAEKPAPKPAVRGGSETILLVEDEPMLRELARTILSDYQYEVLEAASGVEALQVYSQHAGRIDLLLTDMMMPEGMNGRELADNLKARQPGLKVIYTTGYSADVMGGEITEADGHFLQKPYPPPKLAQTVRECLDF